MCIRDSNSAVDTNAVGKLWTLTVDKGTSIGSGAIISSPSAIQCGTTCTTQNAKFLEGQMVTLTAVPDPGKNYFDGWAGDCASAGKALQCTITITKDTSVSALFSLPTYSITTTTPDGHGTITCTPKDVYKRQLVVCVVGLVRCWRFATCFRVSGLQPSSRLPWLPKRLSRQR